MGPPPHTKPGTLTLCQKAQNKERNQTPGEQGSTKLENRKMTEARQRGGEKRMRDRVGLYLLCFFLQSVAHFNKGDPPVSLRTADKRNHLVA